MSHLDELNDLIQIHSQFSSEFLFFPQSFNEFYFAARKEMKQVPQTFAEEIKTRFAIKQVVQLRTEKGAMKPEIREQKHQESLH
jgi:hypothetical protein